MNFVAVTAARFPVCRGKVVEQLRGEVVIRNAIPKVDAPTGRVSAKRASFQAWVEVPLRYVR